MPPSKGIRASTPQRPPLSWEDIIKGGEECSVKDLRETVRLIDGLKVSGSKQDLLDRLKDWAALETESFQSLFGEVSLEDGSRNLAEELQQIDTSSLALLLELRRKKQICVERLRKLSDRTTQHSAVVVEKVRRDYESRVGLLKEEMKEPTEEARREYAKLLGHSNNFDQAHRETLLEKEELNLRHEVGEFESADFRLRLEECEAKLQERERRRMHAERMKRRFIAAIGSEAELMEQAVEPGESKDEHDKERDTVTAQDPQAEPSEVTVEAKQQAGDKPASESGVTVILPPARLLRRQEDGSTVDYPLGPAETVIGRSVRAGIRIVESTVSRSHATVTFASGGFTIADPGSENGTFVNDERVTERKLENGDLIRVGPVEFEFRDN